jgi:hypothetical protein
MMHRPMRLALACALMASVACKDDPSGPPTIAEQHASAKALWQATRPVRYTFVAFRSCECLPDAAGPVRIEVHGTTIVSAKRVDSGAAVETGLWFDINALFDLIGTELVQRPSRLETEYDSGNGHPTYVAYGEREVDGGAVIEVTDFVVLIGGTGGYLRR